MKKKRCHDIAFFIQEFEPEAFEDDPEFFSLSSAFALPEEDEVDSVLPNRDD